VTASAGTIPAVATARTPYPQAARQLLRETLFGAARDELQHRAWSEITMSDIAGAAGVSRQTLYKEFGSRDEFAQAFVIHEGERFLDGVDAAVREHLDDPRAAVGAAMEAFLRSAGEDPLVRILLSDDGTGGMLPFVTTQGMPVVHWATARLTATIEAGWPQAPPPKAALLAESLVRLAISYITAPGGPPETTAAQAGELLGPFIDDALGTERAAAPGSPPPRATRSRSR
jgi:AcrR family transcriptional regulator